MHDSFFKYIEFRGSYRPLGVCRSGRRHGMYETKLDVYYTHRSLIGRLCLSYKDSTIWSCLDFQWTPEPQ